ncbi:Glycosyl hydrolases family 1, N-terminal conserved site [Sesbania bispinosa]|nr:Glycosyl hydrolases family 1, N-terminal conserved site [Sesbania bispinosa]
MAICISSTLVSSLLLLARRFTILEAVEPTLVGVSSLNRSSFPQDFIFGTASSSYQFEGAAYEDGKGLNIWDIYTHEKGRVLDGSNGDVALDQYHRYKEDVQIMKYMNTDAYRFAISWSRILPKGKLSGGINQAGIKYYNNLINELLDNGLRPFVTIFHWDTPQALQDEYIGFFSHKIVNDFQDFAELCFKEFGDRVKHWVTLNEPLSYIAGPKPYVMAHNELLAHAAVVKIYKTKYQASQKGLIGITLNCHWFMPYSNDKLDHQAAQRVLDFMLGWFMDPVATGKYPKNMISLVGNQVPKFTKEQSKLLAGSFDFLGLNYYTSYYAAHQTHPSNDKTQPIYYRDAQVNIINERNGIPLGPRVRMDEFNDPTLTLEEALMDTYRIDYYYRHLYHVSMAIKHFYLLQEKAERRLFSMYQMTEAFLFIPGKAEGVFSQGVHSLHGDQIMSMLDPCGLAKVGVKQPPRSAVSHRFASFNLKIRHQPPPKRELHYLLTARPRDSNGFSPSAAFSSSPRRAVRSSSCPLQHRLSSVAQRRIPQQQKPKR